MLTPTSILAILPAFGGGELMVVLALVLILFGGDRMPQLAKGLGRALRDFKKAAGEVEHEFKRALDEVPDQPPAKPGATPPPPPPVSLPSPAPVQRVEPPAPPGTTPAQ